MLTSRSTLRPVRAADGPHRSRFDRRPRLDLPVLHHRPLGRRRPRPFGHARRRRRHHRAQRRARTGPDSLPRQVGRVGAAQGSHDPVLRGAPRCPRPAIPYTTEADELSRVRQDNQINRTVLRRQLAKEGCENIVLACDGQEGLDLLKQQPGGRVDCVLMDIEVRLCSAAHPVHGS